MTHLNSKVREHQIRTFFYFFLFFLLHTNVFALQVTDMRGLAVSIPDDPQRIATIDDGFIEEVMAHLGVLDRVVCIGSWGMKLKDSFTIEFQKGDRREYKGQSVITSIYPHLASLPCLSSPQGEIINIELLAKINPDLLMIRAGDTSLGTDKAKIQKITEAVQSLGIPLIVLYSPTCFELSDLSYIKKEASVIGSVFHKKEQAEALADFLSETEKMIRGRTSGIPNDKKTSILYLSLRPDVRKKGGSGAVYGINTAESYMMEGIVNAVNAYRGKGTSVPVSAEQIYAMDPDVIVLPTSKGYHPPEELYEAPYFENLSELRAVKNRRVFPMPYSPKNSSRRAEYAIDLLVLAKAAYPDLFKDISLYDFALNFYKKIYLIKEDQAKRVAEAQILNQKK